MQEIKKALTGQRNQLNYKLLFENIPHDLKNISQWVCWEAIWNEERAKFEKLPKNPRTGDNAKTNDSKTWGTFEEAGKGLERFNLSGVGIVLTKDLGIVGIDVDKCFIDGLFTDEAIITINAFKTYTEFSPSGNGIRLFVYGNLPEGRRKKGTFEMYEEGRFLTVTGNRIGIYENIYPRQASINYIHSMFLVEEKKEQPQRNINYGYQAIHNDSELLQKIESSNQGKKFKALYYGNISGYPSQSEAELALCSILSYWCKGDSSRIDSLFRNSALYRDKWDRIQSGSTYGKITIEKAIRGA